MALAFLSAADHTHVAGTGRKGLGQHDLVGKVLLGENDHEVIRSKIPIWHTVGVVVQDADFVCLGEPLDIGKRIPVIGHAHPETDQGGHMGGPSGNVPRTEKIGRAGACGRLHQDEATIDGEVLAIR